MKVLLEIKEDKVAFVMELLSSLKFVKAKPLSPYKSEVLEGLQQAVEEMKQVKEGKLKARPIQELLDEL